MCVQCYLDQFYFPKSRVLTAITVRWN